MPGGRELVYQSGKAVMRVMVTSGPAFAASIPSTLFERPGAILGGAERARVRDVGDTQPPHPSSSALVVIQNWAEELKRLVPAAR